VEAQFASAVVATQPDPADANISIADIRLAIENQFGNQAVPVAITHFRSDFLIQFAALHERDTVALAEILYGQSFTVLLLPWSSQHGGTFVDWNTVVTKQLVFSTTVCAPTPYHWVLLPPRFVQVNSHVPTSSQKLGFCLTLHTPAGT
jgi:hypothetical protein